MSESSNLTVSGTCGTSGDSFDVTVYFTNENASLTKFRLDALTKAAKAALSAVESRWVDDNA